MAQRKGQTGNPHGRPKGSPNKVNALAREAFQLAFEGLNGVSGLIKWAKQNETEFYKLYGRLIPIDTTSNGEPITVNIMRHGD